MASLEYLIRNRVKFKFLSYQFFKVWAKRILLINETLQRNRRKSKLIEKGASVHNLAEIGKAEFDGKKRNLTVGEYSYIGEAYLALYDRIIIYDRVCINNGVKILTASHDVGDPEWKHIKKEVVIEDYVWIGMNSIILPGVRLGKGAVVGAGSVVTKSVPDGCIVVGNPAKIINRKRVDKLNYNPCEFLASNRAWLVG